jgi:hypothetical protein
MYEFATWHASFTDFFIHLRHYSVIGNNYCLQIIEAGFAEQFKASHRTRIEEISLKISA